MLALLVALGAAFAGDAPEISRSAGETGGVVVLWPRVIPGSKAAVPRNAAWQVQQHLQKIVGEVAASRPVDLRPEPERVCPQTGCQAVSVGALLVHQGDACLVVGLVSGPGQSPATLVPWVGQVDLRATSVPFREPPESWITIRDFQPCASLLTPLQEGAGPLKQAIAAALLP